LQSEYQQLVTRYMSEFNRSLKLLNCITPQYQPRVTDHISHIIEFIKKLIQSGYAYHTETGDVYFSVSKVRLYGELSGQKLAYLKSEHRVSHDNKQDSFDFVLWKIVDQEPFWESPWGKGRPGWHVECSVMATHYLGNQIDIHGGGIDLIFPHHENEKSLSESCFGTPFVRLWMHNGLVMVHKEKMSKSLNNFVILHEALSSYDPSLIRYFFIQHHYRSPLEWTDQLIESSLRSYQRLAKLFQGALDFLSYDQVIQFPLVGKMDEAVSDDLNTPVLFSIIFSNMREIAENFDLKNAVFSYCVQVLGINFEVIPISVSTDSSLIQELLQLRDAARKNHNWKEADRLRDELLNHGYIVSDEKIK